MRIQDVIVLTPAGRADPALAIAAARAGARGLLDLEYCRCSEQAIAACDQLAEKAGGFFGVKLSSQNITLADQLLEKGFQELRWVLLAGGVPADLQRLVKEFQSRNLNVLFEAVSLEEAIAAETAGVDGLVLKGHESGGRVGNETAFILAQRVLRRKEASADKGPQVFIQGGIGLHTAAACLAAGADGVVLDSQLLCTRESSLSAQQKQRLQAADGSETLLAGHQFDSPCRVFHTRGQSAVEEFSAEVTRLAESTEDEKPAAMREIITKFVSCENPINLWGQDVALAGNLAKRFVTTAGVVQAIVEAANEHLAAAGQIKPLAPEAPLAKSHGTRYPILQGPMTRVSDTAPFAKSVADGGGLPFLALALLRGKETEKLLEETAALIPDKPWGVGLLGFLPPEIRKEQMAAVVKQRPPFALIAGGRPDQAKELEELGIPTYLHVPSPGLLSMFLKDGARRFIFEGRECGGHVGPRSSFVLWEQMCDVLLETPLRGKEAADFHIVFAGGIHDSLSSSMVAALAAPLAKRGMNVGVLMGTAYLFTEEAVQGGAIVPRFQAEAVGCENTVLLETGPGHAIRCIRTPYYNAFMAERKRLEAAGKTHEEIVQALEWMNIGRLRVASKGLDRVKENGASKLAAVEENDQFERGMYMIGQAAAMHQSVGTIRELHEEVSSGGTARLEKFRVRVEVKQERQEKPCDVAIIGMACHYPGAVGLRQYWENILGKKNAVTEIPRLYWDWRLYYDADPLAKDKIYSKWGGFLPDAPFDPLRYGITPKSMESIEPVQLLLLEAVRHALGDAGYESRPFNRERTAAILGIGGGGGPLSISYGLRSCLPLLDTVEEMPTTADEVMKASESILPQWTEDSFPGFLMNVTVGRVANRFNFGGSNYAIDAACASSLAAVHACLRELEMGDADIALAMGADTVQTPYAYMAFSKTHALSKAGRSRPFDDAADGIVLSEGIGVVVLKRLADAERDGDRIYGVIKGVGASSDGKEKGLTAPNAAGQLRALRRAYSKAGFSPSRLGLVEAHGTGTVVGDFTETQALNEILKEAGMEPGSCALGSVKSMIGHSKCAAGVAGLIKATLSLHHKTLPPTLVETPNTKVGFDESPLYLNTDVRPWVHGKDTPRTAGVSAFGFGGTNFHLALEEYTGDFVGDRQPVQKAWPAELFVFRRTSRSEISKALEKCLADLQTANVEPTDLAAACWRASTSQATDPVLSIVASSVSELKERLALAVELLKSEKTEHSDPRGIYFNETPVEQEGRIGFLFPGQGSQYPDMLAEAAVVFEEVRRPFDLADRLLQDDLPRPLGLTIFPPSAFTAEQKLAAQRNLAATEFAQPAIGAASLGMLHLLRSLGIRPSATAGHSYGELTALCAAGAMEEAALLRLSGARGRVLAEASQSGTGIMAALACNVTAAKKLLANSEAAIANINSPKQTVVSGSEAAIEALLEKCKKEKIRATKIPVSCAFHSSLVAEAVVPWQTIVGEESFQRSDIAVYSNVTGRAYESTEEASALLSEHLVQPVLFQQQIEAMYAAGVRTFVEVGPGSVLTGLVGQILGDQPHAAVATDAKGRSSLVQLSHALGQLLAAGAPVSLERLLAGREQRPFALAALASQKGAPQPDAWVVNGYRSKRADAPEPRLIGQKMNQRSSQKPAAPAGTASTPAVNPSPTSRKEMPAPAPASVNGSRQPAAPPPAPVQQPETPAPLEDDAAAVMLQYQQLMSQFLQTQQAVMTSYLQGAPAGEQAGQLPPVALSTSPQVAAASRMMPQKSDNGDTAPAPVQTEEVPPPSRETVEPVATTSKKQTESAPKISEGLLTEELVRLVSERTGYPPEMLEPDLDLEGDLGVDSIKRVEILGGLADALGISTDGDDPSSSKLEFEKLTTLKTMGEIIAYLVEVLVEKKESPAATVHETETPIAESNGHAAPAISQLQQQNTFDRSAIETQLLELVSDRTGYPPEMLDPDLDLEGDLGIDSIKRVEILGGLADSLGISTEPDATTNIEFEKLTTIRTLGGILDYLAEALGNSPAAIKAEAPQQSEEAAEKESSNGQANANGSAAKSTGDVEIQRGLVGLVDASLPKRGGMLIPTGAVVITSDGRGIAEEIAGRLADFGQAVAVVNLAGEGDFSADPADEQSIGELCHKLRQEFGPIGGLIHLYPLAEENQGSLGTAGDNGRALRQVKSLYLLARELESDLTRAAAEGGAVLLAATALGGTLGYGESLPESYFAGQGGILGFLKCAGMEWPEVLVRTVDLDPAFSLEETADALLAELSDANGPLEVGVSKAGRVTWEPVAGSLDLSRPPEIELNKNDVILVTGGARGITSAIALEIAEASQAKLVLVGRSPLPEERESDQTASLSSAAEMKASLIAQLKAEGKTASPAKVESAYKNIMRDREIRQALQTIQATGSQVEYHSLDVRDESALKNLLSDVTSRLGPITGVIHGAGVIEDKLIRDKTPESFDRVFHTKVFSALALSRLLDPRPLKFCCFFASIASRYGNRGQSDYAAANEVLSKLAIDLDRHWPCRVFAVAWGPWSGLGMVSDLEKHLTARGLKLISPEVGPKLLLQDLAFGQKGQSEVLIAGGAEHVVTPAANRTGAETQMIET